jgi:hypothetical protein
VVVNGNREFLFGGILADHVLVQVLLQFQRFRKLVRRSVRLILTVIFEDGIADGYALIADVSSRIVTGGGDQLADNILTLVAKRTS